MSEIRRGRIDHPNTWTGATPGGKTAISRHLARGAA